MHGIKYFFLNKNYQTIQEGQKKFPGRARAENIIEKHYFLKSRGALDIPGSAPGPCTVVLPTPSFTLSVLESCN
jgi:hypothetical protein